MTKRMDLKEAARIAGTVAGLKEEQIEGLAELFRLVWLEGAKAQQRHDAKRCDFEAKSWSEFMESRGYKLNTPDGDECQSRINTACLLAYSMRDNLADPADVDDEPVPPPVVAPAAEPSSSKAKPRSRRTARGTKEKR